MEFTAYEGEMMKEGAVASFMLHMSQFWASRTVIDVKLGCAEKI